MAGAERHLALLDALVIQGLQEPEDRDNHDVSMVINARTVATSFLWTVKYSAEAGKMEGLM